MNIRIIEAIETIANALDGIARHGITIHLDQATATAATPETMEEAAKRMADYNRDNARQLFGEVLHYHADNQRWYSKDDYDCQPVVFTQYGWRLESDLKDEGIDQ